MDTRQRIPFALPGHRETLEGELTTGLFYCAVCCSEDAETVQRGSRCHRVMTGAGWRWQQHRRAFKDKMNVRARSRAAMRPHRWMTYGQIGKWPRMNADDADQAEGV